MDVPAVRAEQLAGARVLGQRQREEQAVRDVAFRFWQAYERADSQLVCGLMSPQLRATFERALANARRVKGKSCPKLLLAAFRDPSDQPPAATEADSEFKETRVEGNKATLSFDDGRTWRLEKSAGHWRITAFPILPPSLVRAAPGARRTLS